MLVQDWLPGKFLRFSRRHGANDGQPAWTLTSHENGNSRLSFLQEVRGKQQGQVRLSQIPIHLESDASAELIQQAMSLPEQFPEDCVDWNSGFIDMQKGGTIIKDKRNGARCMVVEVFDSGTMVCIIGVYEDSPKFLDSAFYRSIDRMIKPHFSTDAASTL